MVYLIWHILDHDQLSESSNPRINEIANSVDAVRLYLTGCRYWGSLEWRRACCEWFRAFIDTNGIGLGAGGSVANQEIIGPVAEDSHQCIIFG